MYKTQNRDAIFIFLFLERKCESGKILNMY